MGHSILIFAVIISTIYMLLIGAGNILSRISAILTQRSVRQSTLGIMLDILSLSTLIYYLGTIQKWW